MMRILVATDGSEGADRAVDFASHWAKQDGAELLIVNVNGGTGFPDNIIGRSSHAQRVWVEQLLAQEAAEIVTKARARAHKAGVENIMIESRTGDIAQTIIDIAQEKKADVIIVGKRGNGQVTGLLLGSISQKLVSLAPLPVTVVP